MTLISCTDTYTLHVTPIAIGVMYDLLPNVFSGCGVLPTDVAVHARGPWSHLFTGTVEQTHIYDVMHCESNNINKKSAGKFLLRVK